MNRTSEIKGTIYAFFGTRDSLISQDENEEIEEDFSPHYNTKLQECNTAFNLLNFSAVIDNHMRTGLDFLCDRLQ
ncbi:hypothetical protein [Nostoc sp.]|uniref:hypothetical protein n=1 Tax=Nostoc sp. TaxID=1180 RepID=UPI003FA5E2E8